MQDTTDTESENAIYIVHSTIDGQNTAYEVSPRSEAEKLCEEITEAGGEAQIECIDLFAADQDPERVPRR
jgi:hypothetical protein